MYFLYNGTRDWLKIEWCDQSRMKPEVVAKNTDKTLLRFGALQYYCKQYKHICLNLTVCRSPAIAWLSSSACPTQLTVGTTWGTILDWFAEGRKKTNELQISVENVSTKELQRVHRGRHKRINSVHPCSNWVAKQVDSPYKPNSGCPQPD